MAFSFVIVIHYIARLPFLFLGFFLNVGVIKRVAKKKKKRGRKIKMMGNPGIRIYDNT